LSSFDAFEGCSAMRSQTAKDLRDTLQGTVSRADDGDTISQFTEFA
jgi:hypothetical protein